MEEEPVFYSRNISAQQANARNYDAQKNGSTDGKGDTVTPDYPVQDPDPHF